MPTAKSIFRASFIAVSLLVLTACKEQKPTINIAVASNFEQTLKQIVQQYPNKQYQINIIAGSSGVLANQIINHAPYDLFLSADTIKAEVIVEKRHLTTQPQIYAIGILSLWIPESLEINTSNNCIFLLNNIDSIVIANPKTAPYGWVAQEILKNHNIKPLKLIQAANISQAFLYTRDKFVKAGFVPYSMLKNTSQGCQQTFDDKALSQSMVVINEKAQDIYKYILSPEIQLFIQKSGYNINPNPDIEK